jgi:hypothetical protein
MSNLDKLQKEINKNSSDKERIDTLEDIINQLIEIIKTRSF